MFAKQISMKSNLANLSAHLIHPHILQMGVKGGREQGTCPKSHCQGSKLSEERSGTQNDPIDQDKIEQATTGNPYPPDLGDYTCCFVHHPSIGLAAALFYVIFTPGPRCMDESPPERGQRWASGKRKNESCAGF